MSGPRHILVIEDNAADVRLMREALRDLEPPVDLHVASDGEDALLFLRRSGPHAAAPTPSLIFLDFNLPKSDSARAVAPPESKTNLYALFPSPY